MKTVWLLNHYAQEPGGPGGTRHYALARHLRTLGWRAIIVASSLEHGTGRQRIGENEKWRLETFDGVEFLWLKGRGYSGNGGDRVMNMLGYTFAALRLPPKLLPRPDVVVGSSVHPFAAWAGARLAKRFKVPFVFEIRDLWPQTLIDMGRLSETHPMTTALRFLEKRLCRQASRVVTLLPHAHQYLESIGVPKDRIDWISNGVEIADAPPPKVDAADGVFTLMYFGAHGSANGLDNILEAFSLIEKYVRQPAIRLRLIGDGPEKPRLVEHARKLGLRAVSFEPPVAKSKVPALAAEADAFVFNLIDAPVFKYGISSNKLFDYMAAARPVIFCCKSTNNPVAEGRAGPTVPPDKPQALADAILAMAAKSPQERAALGVAGRRHVEQNYAYKSLAERLAATLERCLVR